MFWKREEVRNFISQSLEILMCTGARCFRDELTLDIKWHMAIDICHTLKAQCAFRYKNIFLAKVPWSSVSCLYQANSQRGVLVFLLHVLPSNQDKASPLPTSITNTVELGWVLWIEQRPFEKWTCSVLTLNSSYLICVNQESPKIKINKFWNGYSPRERNNESNNKMFVKWPLVTHNILSEVRERMIMPRSRWHIDNALIGL